MVIYKIISKVIVNQLKSVLPDLIGEAYNAFVLSRHIDDTSMHSMNFNGSLIGDIFLLGGSARVTLLVGIYSYYVVSEFPPSSNMLKLWVIFMVLKSTVFRLSASH